MMKEKITYLSRIISVMVVFYGFMGCTYVLKTDDIPQLQIGSPLRSVVQKTFAFKEFIDIREVKDPFLIKKVDFGSWALDKPVSSLIMIMLKNELERNGHICVTYSQQVKADYIVEGVVYKCSVMINQGLFSPTQIANTGVKLTINHFSDHAKAVLMKSYIGEYRITGSGAMWKTILTQSLLIMIKEISTDTELIDLIRE